WTRPRNTSPGLSKRDLRYALPSERRSGSPVRSACASIPAGLTTTRRWLSRWRTGNGGAGMPGSGGRLGGHLRGLLDRFAEEAEGADEDGRPEGHHDPPRHAVG